MRIIDGKLAFCREPLRTPFGFKGGALTELWQVVCSLRLDNGALGLGVGVQSVLWSDARVFTGHTQAGGNALMLAVTEYALGWLAGREFAPPPSLLASLLPDTMAYARGVTGLEDLSKTFVLNALVPVDFALWQLQAQATGTQSFDTLVSPFCGSLTGRQPQLGNIPLVSYDKTPAEVQALAADGAFLFKIKIGVNPGGRNDPAEMLKADCARLSQIHALVRDVETPYTDTGHIAYYLDANGRYDSPDLVLRLLEHAASIGALERIVLLEEPFPEGSGLAVHNLPVRVAADESAHSAEELPGLLEKGYTAIALKPIAKTLSETLNVYQAAGNTPCFCADLTVPPYMLLWNQQVAARLPVLPGLRLGVVESNGAQNYTSWSRLKALCPEPDRPWLTAQNGLYPLEEAFYSSADCLRPPPGYLSMLSE